MGDEAADDDYRGCGSGHTNDGDVGGGDAGGIGDEGSNKAEGGEVELEGSGLDCLFRFLQLTIYGSICKMMFHLSRELPAGQLLFVSASMEFVDCVSIVVPTVISSFIIFPIGVQGCPWFRVRVGWMPVYFFYFLPSTFIHFVPFFSELVVLHILSTLHYNASIHH